MTSRRRFVLTTMTGALAPSWNARGQAARVYRLGVLRPTRPGGVAAAADTPQPLRDLGYIEGVKLVIEAEE